MERSSPDSKGVTEEDTQHPSTAKQSVGGEAAECVLLNTEGKKSLSYLEDKNEQSLKSETSSHIFIPIRAKILEIQGQSKQTAPINMQIKLYIYIMDLLPAYTFTQCKCVSA